MITARQAPCSTGGRALLRRNPREVRLSLGIPVSSVGADSAATALRANSREVSALLVLRRASPMTLGSISTSGTGQAE